MIKIQIYSGPFIIDEGKIITKEKGLKEVFKEIVKDTTPDQGDPDKVLADRMIAALGTGEIIAYIPEQTDDETVY